jgi:hypothetical protein
MRALPKRPAWPGVRPLAANHRLPGLTPGEIDAARVPVIKRAYPADAMLREHDKPTDVITCRQVVHPSSRSIGRLRRRLTDFAVIPHLDRVSFSMPPFFTIPPVQIDRYDLHKNGRLKAPRDPSKPQPWNKFATYRALSTDPRLTILYEPNLPSVPVMLRVGRNDDDLPSVYSYDEAAALVRNLLDERSRPYFRLHSVEYAFDFINPPWGSEPSLQYRFIDWRLLSSRFYKDKTTTLYVGSPEGSLEISVYDSGERRHLKQVIHRIEYRVKFVRNKRIDFPSLQACIESDEIRAWLYGRTTILKRSVLEMGLNGDFLEAAIKGGAHAVYRAIAKASAEGRPRRRATADFLRENADPQLTSLLNRAIDTLLDGLRDHPEGLAEPRY